MSQRRRSRRSSSKSEFSSNSSGQRSVVRTLIETVMGLSIGLLILAIGVWWIFYRSPPVEDPNGAVAVTGANEDPEQAQSFEAVRESGDVRALVGLLGRMAAWPRDGETPVRLDALNKRMEIARKIYKHSDSTDEQRASAAQALLESMGQYYQICQVEDLNTDGAVFFRCVSTSDEFLGNSDENVARDAVLCKLNALVYETTSGSTFASPDSLQRTLDQAMERFRDDEVVLATVRLLLIRLKDFHTATGIRLIRSVVSRYESRKSPNEKVFRHVRNLNDILILADSGISELARQAQQTQSYDDYLGELGGLIDRPDTGVEFVRAVYRALGVFETAGRNDIALRILERMGQTADSRNDPSARIQAQRMVRFGTIRNMAVGKKFDFNDTNYLGEPVDVIRLSGCPVVIVFYSPNNPASRSLLGNLSRTCSLIGRTNVKVIAVSVEQESTQSLLSTLNPQWININSSVEKTSKIFKRCPVNHVPYFAVVGGDGVLKAINVAESQIKTRVEEVAAASN